MPRSTTRLATRELETSPDSNARTCTLSSDKPFVDTVCAMQTQFRNSTPMKIRIFICFLPLALVSNIILPSRRRFHNLTRSKLFAPLPEGPPSRGQQGADRCHPLFSPLNPRQPVDGVVVKNLAEHRLRQGKPLVGVTQVLDGVVCGKELAIAPVGVCPILHCIPGVVIGHDHQVGSVEDAVLVLDQEG